MSDRPGTQGWASSEMSMGSSVRGDCGGLRHSPQSWSSATCPSLTCARAAGVLLLMCMFPGIFVLTELFKGGFFVSYCFGFPR